jgi:hypothetical protein
MPIISVFGRIRQDCELDANLSYKARFCTPPKKIRAVEIDLENFLQHYVVKKSAANYIYSSHFLKK